MLCKVKYFLFHRSNKGATTIKGCGLCLLDFGRAIDIQAFPRGTQFIGSCDTDSFQCIQMLNNEPWTWQVMTLNAVL